MLSMGLRPAGLPASQLRPVGRCHVPQAAQIKAVHVVN